MNIEEQIKIYNHMQQLKMTKELELRNLTQDMINLKKIIISECPHTNTVKEYHHDGHRSTVVNKCDLCNFYI